MVWQRITGVLKRKDNKAVKNIEGELLGYMVSRHDITLDELRNLKHVEREVILGDKPLGIIMIRIFNPDIAKERDVTIDGYASLDKHPELILYEGNYREVDGIAMDINMEKK
jgi:hypothetical protein